MKTIAIANQKGGVGKSTLAIQLLNFSRFSNLKALFIDLDPQGNSSKSLLKKSDVVNYNSIDLFNKQVAIEAMGSLSVFKGNPMLADVDGEKEVFQQNMKNLSDIFDVCIIDTPPTASHLQVHPLLVSDYVISPLELQEWSYDGSLPFLTLLSNIRKMNGNQKPKFLGLLPNRVETRNAEEREELNQFLNNPNLRKNLFGDGKFYIKNSVCYKKATAGGVGVWELKNSSTARKQGKNTKAICQAILNEMQLN